MADEDEVGQEFDRMVRSALMGVMMTGEMVARARDRKARDEATEQERAAREAKELTRENEHVRREQSRAVNQRVRRPEFWKNATPEQVEDLVTHVVHQVPVDANEQGTREQVFEQLKDRFGLNADEIARMNPQDRRETILNAFSQTADARFAQDNPDVSRTLYDRLRRREYWDQASPDQVAQVAELTGRLAPHDTRAAEADAVLREQLHTRYDIDLDKIRASHPEQAERTASLSAELDTARRARDVAAGRDETRLVYDRVRRPEFWKQATPEQIAEVVKYTHEVAPYDLAGREAQQIVAEQLRAKFSIDLVDLQQKNPSDAAARRAALIDALDDHLAATRETDPRTMPETTGTHAQDTPSAHGQQHANADRAAEAIERAEATRDLSQASALRAGTEHDDKLHGDVAGDGDVDVPVTERAAELHEAAEHRELSAQQHEGRADALHSSAQVNDAHAADLQHPGYQRVTDAELTNVPRPVATSRKQAATSFPQSTSAGLRGARSDKAKSTQARVDRGRVREADRTHGQER